MCALLYRETSFQLYNKSKRCSTSCNTSSLGESQSVILCQFFKQGVHSENKSLLGEDACLLFAATHEQGAWVMLKDPVLDTSIFLFEQLSGFLPRQRGTCEVGKMPHQGCIGKRQDSRCSRNQVDRCLHIQVAVIMAQDLRPAPQKLGPLLCLQGKAQNSEGGLWVFSACAARTPCTASSRLGLHIRILTSQASFWST